MKVEELSNTMYQYPYWTSRSVVLLPLVPSLQSVPLCLSQDKEKKDRKQKQN